MNAVTFFYKLLPFIESSLSIEEAKKIIVNYCRFNNLRNADYDQLSPHFSNLLIKLKAPLKYSLLVVSSDEEKNRKIFKELVESKNIKEKIKKLKKSYNIS